VHGRRLQGGVTAVLLYVGIGSCREHQPGVARSRGTVDNSDPMCRNRFGIGASGQQYVRGFGLAKKARQVQWGETIAAARVHLRCIGRKQHLQPRDIAQRRRFVQIQISHDAA